MTFTFANLDTETRRWMLAELDEEDIPNDRLYLSPRLTSYGQSIYPDLLRNALREGNAESLGAALQGRGVLAEREFARNPRGGPDIDKKVPVTAAQTLSEGEFNRFYARGLCRRVLAGDENGEVLVYRARESANPRPLSVALVGTRLRAKALLDDLRSSIGVDPALGLPPANSGLSVRLP